jgi:hypothetical protein
MNQIIRRLILAFTLTAGLAPAFAQAPSPVPALPDTERRTTYTISGSSCACAVGFQLYGDGTDYQNWLEVYLNGARVNFDDPTFGWTITSSSGQLGRLPLPITDAAIAFNNPQTGTVQIVGARRPRRVSQFSEGAGVTARDLNVALTDLVAQSRETWDRTNDVTGRALMSPPGNTLGLLPPPSLCQGAFLVFDVTGKNPQCTAGGPGSGNVVGPVTSTPGHFALFATNTGSLLQDGGAPASSATTDTTNASNISSGTLGSGRLPAPFTNGTASGNASKFGTVGAPFISGNCVQVDANGNLATTLTSCQTVGGSTPYTDSANTGLVADIASHNDGAMGSGSAVLNSATGTFTNADVGKHILVWDAGSGGGDLITTIASFQSPTQVTLSASNASGGAVSSKPYIYGTDNSPRLATVLTNMSGHGFLWIRAGAYGFWTQFAPAGCQGFTFEGAANNGGGQAGGTVFYWAGGNTNAFVFGSSTGGCRIDQMQITDFGHHTVNNLIQITNNSGSDPANNWITNSTLSSFGTSCNLLNVDKSIEGNIIGNNFGGCNASLVLANGNYAINYRILYNQFTNSSIIGGGEGITFQGNEFNPTSNGIGNKFGGTSASNPYRGLDISGSWFGDVTVCGGTWIDIYAIGFAFHGNRISGCGTGSANIAIILETSGFASRGFAFEGNSVNGFTAGFLGITTAANGGIICGNAFDSVTTPIVGFGTSVLSASCNN